MTILDYINGWDAGVLQKAVDNCHCNEYGDVSFNQSFCVFCTRISDSLVSWIKQPTCCVQQNIFDMNQGQQCHITKSIDEQSKSFFSFKYIRFLSLTNILISATGTLLRLAGNNPVQPEGKTAIAYSDNSVPPLIAPVYAYTGTSPTATGQIVTGQANVVAASSVPTTSSTPTPPKPSSSSSKVHNVAAVISTTSPATGPTPTIQTPSPPTTISVPTLSHSSTHLPTLVSPAAAKSISSSSSDSDPLETCGTAPKRRQLGLDYHRHHRRLSHVPRHDHDFFHDNYWIPCYFKSFFCLLFLLHLSYGPLVLGISLGFVVVLGIEFVAYMYIYLISHFISAVFDIPSRCLHPIVRYVLLISIDSWLSYLMYSRSVICNTIVIMSSVLQNRIPCLSAIVKVLNEQLPYVLICMCELVIKEKKRRQRWESRLSFRFFG